MVESLLLGFAVGNLVLQYEGSLGEALGWPVVGFAVGFVVVGDFCDNFLVTIVGRAEVGVVSACTILTWLVFTMATLTAARKMTRSIMS